MIQQKCTQYFTALTILLVTNIAYADRSLAEISKFGTGVAGGLAKAMYGISFVLGVGFLLGGIIQYKQHRDNPQMVRLSTPIIYLILGLAFVALPFIAMLSSGSFAAR